MKILVSLYLWIVGLVSLGLILISGIALSFVLRPAAVDRFLKTACRAFLKVMHVRLEVQGAEAVPRDRAVLFMANHVSLFDVPVLEAAIPVFMRGVEADRQFRWPLYGWAVRRFGNIPIRREDVHASIRSMGRAGEWLRAGRSLAVMPEGHRTKDGRLGPFKKLPFHLAKQAGVDIVPMGLSGLYHLKAKHSWIVRPTTVTVKFGAPVAYETIRQLSVEQLRDRIRGEISGLIERP
jgi:1-acyl-sn-glycerol-3-phosphate acyltransferase